MSFFLNDIALYKLVKPFELGEKTNIFPACLLDKNKKATSFENAFSVASWGSTKNIEVMPGEHANGRQATRDESESPRVIVYSNQTKLLKTKLTPADPSDYVKYGFKAEQHILAHSENSSLCDRDKGSPLSASHDGKAYVVGIMTVAFFSGNDAAADEHHCHSNSFSVSTPIQNYLDWISSYVGDEVCLLS